MVLTFGSTNVTGCSPTSPRRGGRESPERRILRTGVEISRRKLQRRYEGEVPDTDLRERPIGVPREGSGEDQREPRENTSVGAGGTMSPKDR